MKSDPPHRRLFYPGDATPDRVLGPDNNPDTVICITSRELGSATRSPLNRAIVRASRGAAGLNPLASGCDQSVACIAGRSASCSVTRCSQLMIPAAVLLGTHSASAESRLALVIGQSAYRSVPALPNPANDARAVTQLLTDSGFEVSTAADLSQSQMREAVSDFAGKVAAKGADTVALVFYAGHGLQIDGENFLVPVDIDPEAGSRHSDPGGAPQRHPEHADVGAEQDAHPDARCLPQQSVPGLNKTAGGGLAIVDAKVGAPGTFLSFSTSPGAVAEDGSGSNSPYTNALLAAGKEQNIPIEETFKRVRLAVNKVTEGRQTPWDSSSLTEDFRFSGASVAGPKPAAAAEEDGRRVDARSEGQAGRGGQRADRGRRHRRSL